MKLEVIIFAIYGKKITSRGGVKSDLRAGVLLCFCWVGVSQNGCGEFLILGRRILNSIGVTMAVNIPLGRRIKNLGRRIKDFCLSWAGEIYRSPGQNKTPVRVSWMRVYVGV